MKEIKLTQGKVALVDDEDFEYLNQFKWQAKKGRNTYYAIRGIVINGKHNTVLMHREILKGDIIDHKNHNGLHNYKSNLRPCTHQENNRNQRVSANTSSIYKGVSWHTKRKKWMSYIVVDGAIIHLGRFKSEIDAAIEYNKAASLYFKEFAYLNII